MQDKLKLLFIIMQIQNKISKLDYDSIDNSEIDDLLKFIINKSDELGEIIFTMEIK